MIQSDVAFETGLMRLMLCARHCNKCQLGTLVKSGTLTGSRPERAAVATLNEVGPVWCGMGGMSNALDAALTHALRLKMQFDIIQTYSKYIYNQN